MKRYLWPIALLLCVSVSSVSAGEFEGKLERIDRHTVTLLGPNQTRLVLKVDRPDVQKAAAFVGKSVSVEFASEEGHKRLLMFRPLGPDAVGRPQKPVGSR
ncbi:MAG: hypothetical protein AB1646_23510 [Thermodesulfobacteriota bacterium]